MGEILLLAIAIEWQRNSGLGPQTLIPIAKEVCSYFLCKAVWATSLNSSRHVCRGGGCRGGSNQVASLWQPRCNSNSRQCKKTRVGLAGRRELMLKNHYFAQAAVILHHSFVFVEEPKGWQQPSALDQRGNLFAAGGSWMKLFC